MGESLTVSQRQSNKHIFTMSRDWLGRGLNAVDNSLNFYWSVRARLCDDQDEERNKGGSLSSGWTNSPTWSSQQGAGGSHHGHSSARKNNNNNHSLPAIRE